MNQVEVITVGELIEHGLRIYRQSNIAGGGGEYVSYDRGYICLMAAEIAYAKKIHFNPAEFSRNLGRAVDAIIEGRSRNPCGFRRGIWPRGLDAS